MILRQGRKVKKTIYVQEGRDPSDEDRLVGYIEDPEIAKRMVDASNFMDALERAGRRVTSQRDSKGPGSDFIERIRDTQAKGREWTLANDLPGRFRLSVKNGDGGWDEFLSPDPVYWSEPEYAAFVEDMRNLMKDSK